MFFLAAMAGESGAEEVSPENLFRKQCGCPKTFWPGSSRSATCCIKVRQSAIEQARCRIDTVMAPDRPSVNFTSGLPDSELPAFGTSRAPTKRKWFKEPLIKSVRGECFPFAPFDTPRYARHSGRTGNASKRFSHPVGVSNHGFGLNQRFLRPFSRRSPRLIPGTR